MQTLHETNDVRSLRGRVALVTGAGTGIGRAAALEFARRGAAVALVGRRKDPLVEVEKEIASRGGRAVSLPTDLSDAEQASSLPKRVVERLGALDFAFNNAGVSSYAPIEQQKVSDFDEVMATNVRAVWLLIQGEVAQMRATGRGGAIVNTSSIAATGGTAGLSIYAASKGALDSMVRALALELGPDGIRLNNVSPGVIRTPMSAGLPEDYLASIAKHSALKRIGEPQDVADVAVWLCSEEARFITGQSVLVDGGFNIAGLR
jgi:NAD(P)-dependent dehydrogenase (short-subunit alcohol dehydrogenase family)